MGCLKLSTYSYPEDNPLKVVFSSKWGLEGSTPEQKKDVNYFTYGMMMPGRNGESASSEYRYGFNGMEKDDEVKGAGNSYTTEFRQYDPRLGRWLSLDPVMHHNMSPYNSFDNNPLSLVDPNGANAGDYFDKETGEYLGTDGFNDGLRYKVSKEDFEASPLMYRKDYLSDKATLTGVQTSGVLVGSGSSSGTEVRLDEFQVHVTTNNQNHTGLVDFMEDSYYHSGSGVGNGVFGFALASSDELTVALKSSGIYNLARTGKFTSTFTSSAGGSPIKLTWGMKNLPNSVFSIPSVSAAHTEAQTALKAGNFSRVVNPTIFTYKGVKFSTLQVAGWGLGVYNYFQIKNARMAGDVNYTGTYGDNNYYRDQTINAIGSVHWYGALLNFGYNGGKWIEDWCDCNIQLIDTYQPPKGPVKAVTLE